MFWELVVAYVLGGLTVVPLLLLFGVAIVIYTSTPVGDSDPTKPVKAKLDSPGPNVSNESIGANEKPSVGGTEDLPHAPATAQRVIQGWLTARRTFFDIPLEGSYVNNMVRSFLDARSKDPKRARPRDTFFAVLKGSVLFLYEDEGMSECWAAIEMSSYDVSIYYPANDDGGPIGTGECAPMLDGELFSRRNSIVLRARPSEEEKVRNKTVATMPSVAKDMALGASDEVQGVAEGRELQPSGGGATQQVSKSTEEDESATGQAATHEGASDQTRPWFLFIKGVSQMEDWYLALQHASINPAGVPRLTPLLPVFSSTDMDVLVNTLDHQADPIPMRWLNALIGRLFFSVYRTARIEEFIMSRIRRKLAKIKRPSFLTDIIVRQASVGSTAPMFSKPMLKELTKEGEASVEVGFHYKGEFKIIVEATAIINLGPRFKSYAVKIVLAIVLKEIEGNLLLRVKTPPSNRIWYAFTSVPKLELEVQPVVSDRQIKWSMILKPIESMLKDAIQDSVVLPNMDDIPFFDTSDCAVRGGIFADAKRPERTANFDDPGKLTRSNSQKSQSLPHTEVGEQQTRIGGLVLTGVDRADSVSSLPSLARGEEAEPLATSNPDRRSAWFTSPKKDTLPPRRDLTSGVGANVAEIALESGTEPPSLAISTPLAGDRDMPYSNNSTLTGTPDDRAPPSSQESTLPPTLGTSASTDPTSPPLSAPSAIGDGFDGKRLRSQSAQSHKSTMSSDISSWLSSRTSAGVGSDGSEDDRPNTAKTSAASTLIANWKTKAAEKQLGVTARETMKKWGWGAGSKTRESGPSDDPKGNSPPPKLTLPKQTYAEMRAQVEERRQAELSQRSTATANHSSKALPASSQHAERIHSSPPSEPVTPPTTGALETPVSERVGPRKRTPSSSSSLIRRNSNSSSNGYTAGVSPLTSPRLHATTDVVPPALSPRQISPSLPKATTEVSHLSLTSVPSLPPSSPSSPPTLAPNDSVKRRSSTSSDLPLPDDPLVRARTLSSISTGVNPPVFVAQPSSAAMMAIPAIHASRRGEIMALGNSPSPAVPQPAPESPPVVPRIGVSIQNVYRLFNKNSVIGSNKAGVVPEPSQVGVTAGSSSSSSAISERAPNPDPTTEDADWPTTNRRPPPLPSRKPTKGLFVQDRSRTNPEITAGEQMVPTHEGKTAVPEASIIPAGGESTTDRENTIAIEFPLSESINRAAHARPTNAIPDGDTAAGKGSDAERSTMMSHPAPERPDVKLTSEDGEHLPPSETDTPAADPPPKSAAGKPPSSASVKTRPPPLPPR